MVKVQIYVGTYKKYNNGNLFGKWYNLQDFESFNDFLTEIKTLHKDEHDPEFMFQDFQCPKFIKELGLIDQSYLSNDVFDIIQKISSSGLCIEVIEAYCEAIGNAGMDIDELLEKISDTYYGKYENDEDFAYDLLETTGGIPELPNYIYIDWEKTAKNIMQDYTCDNGYYFRLS